MLDFASLLTTAQNLAQNVNGIAQTLLNIQGAQTEPAISAATLVLTGPGRLAMVSVVDPGSADGVIYDGADTTATTGALYTIPQTAGVVFVNLPVTNGIVVAPGTGQVVTVSYSART